MVKITPQLVIGASVATVATAGVAYAVYFDYRRRNDPAFRKRLAKERHAIARQTTQSQARERATQTDALRAAVRQLRNERPPQSVEEREAYFLEQVAMGEALAARGPSFYVPAAIAFFKGLQIYPNPEELLMIYSRTQPAEVLALLMDALKYSVTEGASGGPRGAAILEEIDDSAPSTSSASGPASASGSRTGSGTGQGRTASNAGSSQTSYVDVDYPTPPGTSPAGIASASESIGASSDEATSSS